MLSQPYLAWTKHNGENYTSEDFMVQKSTLEKSAKVVLANYSGKLGRQPFLVPTVRSDPYDRNA